MSVHAGLEGITEIRGLGSDKLAAAAASYALRPNFFFYFAIGQGSRVFVVCFVRTSCGMLFYQAPGRPMPHIHRPRYEKL